MQELNLPIAHIDTGKICHNFNQLTKISTMAKAEHYAPFAKIALPKHFGNNHGQDFIWPSQLAVIKSDAYGHGQVEVAKALIDNGVDMFASGSVQECLALRLGLKEQGKNVVILNLLGPLDTLDIDICVNNGIIPLIHNKEQLELLKSNSKPLPIAIKCNSGMARLGFDSHELDAIIASLKSLPKIMPVLALSHLHSADSENVVAEIKTQGAVFAQMLNSLRATWPNIAASLANSAGTIFTKEITAQIGANICRPGISLYGSNPFFNTSHESRMEGLLPAMHVSAPILSTRQLKAGHGIGYGHIFTAKNQMDIAIIGCGYANGFSRSLTHKGQVCIAGTKVPLVGRVAMQMIYADISKVQEKSPKQAWLLNGPYEDCISAEELSSAWGTITYEIFCILGNNGRNYTSFERNNQFLEY